jgi:hypothetical protein
LWIAQDLRFRGLGLRIKDLQFAIQGSGSRVKRVDVFEGLRKQGSLGIYIPLEAHPLEVKFLELDDGVRVAGQQTHLVHRLAPLFASFAKLHRQNGACGRGSDFIQCASPS